MYTLLQNNQQSANVAIPKLHAQVMLTQMNVREGIKKFGEKGNEALASFTNGKHYCQSTKKRCHMMRKRKHYDT